MIRPCWKGDEKISAWYAQKKEKEREAGAYTRPLLSST
jgi:hypothetical protein